MFVDYHLIGKNLKRIRKERGLSQSELAEKVFMSASYYNRIENGKKILSLDTVFMLAAALDTYVDLILLGNPRLSPLDEIHSDLDRYECSVLTAAMDALYSILKDNRDSR